MGKAYILYPNGMLMKTYDDTFGEDINYYMDDIPGTMSYLTKLYLLKALCMQVLWTLLWTPFSLDKNSWMQVRKISSSSENTLDRKTQRNSGRRQILHLLGFTIDEEIIWTTRRKEDT